MANQVAYGFIDIQHLFDQRVTEIGVEVIRNAVIETTAAWNEEISTLLSVWAMRSIKHKELVRLPSNQILQPIDQWGNPLPVISAGEYDVGYPIDGGGTAWGTNRVSQELITVEEVNDYVYDSIRGDSNWLRAHMLSSVLDNVAWSYKDQQYGTLTVQPLANNDSVTYLKTGAVAATTDNHYSAQADAITDAANPFPGIYDELQEHPSNSGPFVSYVPTNLTDSIESLEAFLPTDDPDVIRSSLSDRLSSDGTDTILGPGSEILGKANRMWIVEWRNLPDNYIVSMALGASPFMLMREYPAPKLQGLFPEFHSPDGNLFINRLLRYCGFGVRDRVAACVHQVGNATYQVPTGFNAPLNHIMGRTA